MLKPKYPRPLPSELVGTEVEGLISHVKNPFFCWLQRDSDGIADLVSGDVGELHAEHVGIGDCVTVRWEGEWYRGEVMDEKGSKVVVHFVDWGNTETLTRTKVRKSVEGEIVKEVGALRCKIIDEDDMNDFKLKIVRLKCVAVYDDVFMMKKNFTQLNLPLSENIPCELAAISGDCKAALFHPKSLQDSFDWMTRWLERRTNLLFPLVPSDVFCGQLCGSKFSEDGVMYRAKIVSVKNDMVEVIYIDYGNSELRSFSDLFELPEEILSPNPHVVMLELDGAEKFPLESVKVVKLSSVNGRILAQIDANIVEKSEDVENEEPKEKIDASNLPFACSDIRLKSGMPPKATKHKNCLSIIVAMESKGCLQLQNSDLNESFGNLGCKATCIKFFSQSRIVGNQIRKDLVFQSEKEALEAKEMIGGNSSVKTFLLTESELGFGLNPVLSEAEMMSIVLDYSEGINIMKFFDGKVEQTEKSISFRFASLASLNLFLYNNGVPAKAATKMKIPPVLVHRGEWE